MGEHHFVTGVAGFIGSHLADSLLASGYMVSGLDDFSLGRYENIEESLQSSNFHVDQVDASDLDALQKSIQAAMKRFGPISKVWHLAANSDISAGIADATIDFSRTLKTTFCLIEVCKALKIQSIAFASTSAIYGQINQVIEEHSGPLLPISTYGAMKLASEALLSAATETSFEKIWIFRFPNVVGPRATHGALHDFMKRLKENPRVLNVLGNGKQSKPYLHVSELIDAMRYIVFNADEKRNVFNIGPCSEGTAVKFLAEEMVAQVAPGAQINYGDSDRGWVGDVPYVRYSAVKLARLGWEPRMSSNEAVKRAIHEMSYEQAVS